MKHTTSYVATIKLEEFNSYYVLFGEKTKNNIIDNSDFCNILYSTPIFSLNNIIVSFNLYDIFIENYFNKYKCTLNQYNAHTCDALKQLEQNILFKYETTKQPVFKLSEQIEKKHIKLFSNVHLYNSLYKDVSIVLKISGLWENDTEYGIIYKFMCIKA